MEYWLPVDNKTDSLKLTKREREASLSKAKIGPLVCNNLEMVPNRMRVSISHQ